MRVVKQAIAKALATDDAVAALVPSASVYATERATIPQLPSIEIVAVDSTLQETGPLTRHLVSIEITVRAPSEDDADEQLNAIVRAIRQRLADAALQGRPIVRDDGEVVPVGLLATRWSTSASDASSVIRGAAVAVECGSDDA